MHIDKNSYGTLALVYTIGLAVLIPLFIFGTLAIWSVAVETLVIVFCLWQTAFFRVPVRNRLGDAHKVSSVADGKVVIIDKVFESEHLKKECIQVSVYMDFFDVHANFWPIDGEVTYYKYHPGRHVLAFKPLASEENEHACTGIRNADGKEIFFKQLAGTFARRITCYSEPGLQVKAGEQCGIIKFGSRIDMFLPLDAQIDVELGQEVRACETIIARI